MKPLWIAFIAILWLPSAWSYSFSGVEQVSQWGQQFEAGELNFLQLKMLLSLGRDALMNNAQEKMVQVGEGEDQRRGWNVQAVQELLGKPTGTENFLWIENRKESRYVEEALPRWEKTVFDGPKIKITLFANPQAIEQENKLLQFYWMDFGVQFKRPAASLDFRATQNELRQGFESYYKTGANLDELARTSAKLEQNFNKQLSENRENCLGFLQEIFGTTPNEAEKIEWKGTLFQGQNLKALMRGDEWTESKWHGLHVWIELNPQNPELQIQQPNALQTESRESLRQKKASELLEQFRETLVFVQQQARSIDATRSVPDSTQLYSKIQSIGLLSDALTEKANREEGFSMEQYQNQLRQWFTEFTKDFSKQNTKEKNFKISLLKKTIDVKEAFCQGEETPCQQFEACVNNACTNTKGGNENCENQVDDDGDTIIDCQDPDCIDFLPCHRKCEPICNQENGCWPCTGQNCNQYCELCGQCQNNNPNNPDACQTACQPCSDCSNTHCANTCEECWNCEDQYYGSGCRPDCKQCNECVQTRGGENCGTECKACNICNYRKGNFQCGPNEQFNETNGGCESTQQQSQCPEGQHWENEQCVQNQSGGCPEGQHEENGQCVPNQPSCPEGEHWENTVCCPDGYHEEAGRCGANVPSCPEGQIWCETECRTAACSNDSQCDDQDPLTTDICQNAGSCAAECTHQTGKVQETPFSKWFGILSITGLATLPEEPPETGPGCEQVHCSVHQYCNAEKGWCDCKKGFWDCDGDWSNGCESTEQCKGCQQDSDCAPTRCSEDKQRIAEFKCKQGGSHTEEIANAEIGGFCKTLASGETEQGFWVGAWGEKMDSFEPAKQAAHSEFSKEWCQLELDSLLEERKQLEQNANPETMQWFFKEFVQKDTKDFEKQAQALFSVFDAFQGVNGDLARNQECLGQTGLPSSVKPVRVEFQSDIGKVEIWEEEKQTSFFGKPVEALSPYVRAWIFPAREQFKDVFREGMKKEKPGPTPADLAQLSKDPKAMETIQRISNAYGGKAQILIEIRDGQEIVMKQLLSIDPENLIAVQTNEQAPQEVDIKLSVSYDFFYNMLSNIFKHSQKNQIVRPYWEEQEKPFNVDEAVIGIQIFTGILGGIFTGDVQVEPIWAIPGVIGQMQDLIFLMSR